jgi:hypothetical protein
VVNLLDFAARCLDGREVRGASLSQGLGVELRDVVGLTFGTHGLDLRVQRHRITPIESAWTGVHPAAGYGYASASPDMCLAVSAPV